MCEKGTFLILEKTISRIRVEIGKTEVEVGVEESQL
jgi:hypothetical protein